MSGEILVPANPNGAPAARAARAPTALTGRKHPRATTLGGFARRTRYLKRVQAAKLAAIGAAVFAMVIVALIALT
jgi:hypothetical protein